MRKYLGPLFLSLLGLACHVAFRIIDAQIELDGPLVEPFFLIPIGYLLLCFGYYYRPNHSNSLWVRGSG